MSNSLLDKMLISYIGLGSNLDHPLKHCQEACKTIEAHSDIELLSVSSWYRSKAIGPGEQPDYINGAIKVASKLTPSSLLLELHKIENTHGRIRTVRWGARTLDLDILYCEELSMNTDDLKIPHPRMLERNFVIFPLHDIAPNLVFAEGKTIREYMTKLGDNDLEKLDLWTHTL